jgi:hypothetical protein
MVKPLQARKSKKGYSHAWFYDDVYLSNYRVIWGSKKRPLTNEDVTHYMATQFRADYVKDGANWNACTFRISTNLGGMVTVFAFRTGRPTIGEITHEAVHGVNYTFEEVGATPTVINDEPTAYYTGYLAGNIAKCLGME